MTPNEIAEQGARLADQLTAAVTTDPHAVDRPAVAAAIREQVHAHLLTVGALIPALDGADDEADAASDALLAATAALAALEALTEALRAAELDAAA